MTEIDLALVTALRAVADLQTICKHSSSNLSIVTSYPKQTPAVPGIVVDIDDEPLNDTDSSALREAKATLFCLSKDRKTVREIQGVLQKMFLTSEKREKSVDIGTATVYCIGTRWDGSTAPVWNAILDCFEGNVSITIKWSIK